MVNKAGNLGREGESGVINHLNRWFDNPKLFGPRRARSKGKNDEGDITNIPLTMIECKNYKRPVLTSLMNNARGKAIESECPVWWLTIKKRRKSGAESGGWWYASTDFDAFLDFLDIDISDDEIDDLMGVRPKRSGEIDRTKMNFKEPVSYTFPVGDLSAKFGKRFDPPTFKWSVMVIGDGRAVNQLESIYDALEWFVDSYDELTEQEETELIVPAVLVRGSGATPETWDNWYIVTTVHFMCRILESLSLLPQNEDEYDENSEMYWKKHTVMKRGYPLTRFPEHAVAERIEQLELDDESSLDNMDDS